MKLLRFLLIITLLLQIQACGQKGALYTNPQPQEPENLESSAENENDKDDENITKETEQ